MSREVAALLRASQQNFCLVEGQEQGFLVDLIAA